MVYNCIKLSDVRSITKSKQRSREGPRTDDKNTFSIFSKTSRNKVHIEEKEIKEQKVKKKEEYKGSNFKYPWDRSNLKSLQIDLKDFEKLDDYAAKLPSTGSLDHLTKQLVHAAHTDVEKVRAIWIWICHHIEYDIIGLYNEALRSIDPKEILRSGKGVCAGYSSLFQDMCSRAGITCMTVNGYAKGAGYQVGQNIPDDSNHAWNMVYLEGSWHPLDSTWGAGHIDESKFTFEYNEFFFLTHPALFIENHYPDKTEHQLLQPRVSRKQFQQLVFRKGDFYNLGLLSVQPETGTINSETGKVSITIESRQNLKFTFDVNGAEHGVIQLLKCGMKLDVYLQKTGQQVLRVYAMLPGRTSQFVWVLDYKILCHALKITMKIPKCLHNPVGPSWVTEEAGLLEPSHTEPVIHTVDGYCTFSFKIIRGLNFLCSLHSDEIQMTSDMEKQHVFLTQTEDKAEIKVRHPCSGTYVLKIFAKPEDSKSSSYSYLCNYLIICTNPSVKWPEYPLTYSAWGKNFHLVHPLEGVLPKGTNVSFKLQIPDVSEVCIDGKEFIPLIYSDSGYWEVTCSTVNRKELSIMIPSNKPNSWQYILRYAISK
ncbi:kyphoscoliosis peptidase-like [Rhinoderma darwinii]|uniref:kyphoscoliosis peptidase-like n=1 Tax=Rhinoderma darwinii TaxID=43563 RepID=UPI003F670E4F